MATRSLHPASGLIPPPSSGGHRTSADAPGPAKTTLLLSDKVRILVFCLPSRGSLSAHGLLPAPGPFPVCGSFPSRGSLSTCGPLPSRGSLSAHGLLPAPGPFPVCGSFPSRGSLSTCGPLPSRGSLSAHGPFPAPGPLPVCGSFPSRSSLPTPTHLPASDSRPFRGLSPRTSPLFLGPEPFLPPSGAESRPPGARSVGKAGPQLSSPCREERTGRCANLSPPFARRKSASSFRRRAKPCRCCSRVRRSAHLPAGTIACRPAPAFVVPPHPMPAGGAVSVRPRSRRRGGERAVLRRTKVASRTGPPFSAAFSGAVSPRFFLLPPDGSGRHMTYRNRAIVPPRCGLQRAGSVPPRSAERRAVRRPRSGRATADGSPPVHGFRPSCGTDSAAPGGRLLGRRDIRRPPPVSRRVSVILPFRINKRPPPLDKRLRRSYLCRVSVSRAPPASGNQVYLGRPPSTASRAIREIELIPPARTRTSCGRAPQRSVRFFPGLRPRQALPIPALAGCGA